MATRRTRGIRKSYVESPLVFDDDDEPVTIPAGLSGDDDDFDAQSVDQQQEVADEDDEVDQDDADDRHIVPDPSSDEDEALRDDGPVPVSAIVDVAKRKGPQPRPKRTRNTGAGMIQSRKGFHDIPHYPLETRIVTRVYAGPLRRYARYSALRDSMYGPEYPRIRIIWDLEMRWADFPVLPPRLPPSHKNGVAPSPWVPASFERKQERLAHQWYERYHKRDCKKRDPFVDYHLIESRHGQTYTQLNPMHGQSLLPRADNGGDLVALIGPWNKQKQVRLGDGDSVPFAPSGLPTDDPDAKDTTPTGWLLDIGGITLAMGWAPSRSRDKQVLAIASIPFADQAPAGKPGTTPAAPDASLGCIQLWEFTADAERTSINGMAAPSEAPPRLLAALCFNWGRPKRLQWCPVPMESSGAYGMLAVLCGDGQARVIDCRTIDPAHAPQYGPSCPPHPPHPPHPPPPPPPPPPTPPTN